MKDLFKNDNYEKNFYFLVKAIKLREINKVDEQFNKMVKDLSQALKSFTNEADDIAKFVIYTDLNNYIESMDKKPSKPFRTLKEIWNSILGKDTTTNNNIIKNFTRDKLSSFTFEKAAEYTNTLKNINLLKEILSHLEKTLDLKENKESQNKSHKTNLENKPKEDTFELQKKKIKRPAMPPPPPPVTKTISSDSKNKLSYGHEDSGYESLSNEEHRDILDLKEKNDKILTKNLQSSKLPSNEIIYAVVSKKHIEEKRKYKQEQKPKVPPKPRNLVHATQERNTKQKSMGSKVKAIVEKFEQNQVKENTSVQLTGSKTVPKIQTDTNVKQDYKLSASKMPILLTHVNTKEIVERFEGQGKQ